ncbi:LptA/OstA family protein [Rickettsiaceae bacterium]|nr:LptA/OstA family protein [Rickettsiaceae bacterium]
MNRIFIFRIFIICLVCIYSTYSYAGRLNISSDSLRMQNDNMSATFLGNVKLVFNNFELITDRLIVFYSNSSDKKEIEKIVIPVSLKAINMCYEEIVTADSGEFDNSTKKLTLEKNVRILRDGNTLVTDKVVYSSYLQKIQQEDNAK